MSEVKMKKIIYSMLLMLTFYGCGSTKSLMLQRDPSFNQQNFLNSSITVFPPLAVTIANAKTSGYNEENVKTIATKVVKSKIESASSNTKVKVGQETVPLFFRGILLNKDDAMKFLKNIDTKYIVFIRQVLVGVKTEQQRMTQGMFNGAPLSTVIDKNTTTTNVFIDVWDRDMAKSVFSIEAEADFQMSYIVAGLESSISNAVDEFIKNVKK